MHNIQKSARFRQIKRFQGDDIRERFCDLPQLQQALCNQIDDRYIKTQIREGRGIQH
jgi:hypothetical protein